MPEIPEMERYRELLSQAVLGKRIQNIIVERPRSINVQPGEFISSVTGGIIEGISRRAKYLVFHLYGGLFLLTHMMLDGRLFYGPAGQEEGLPGKPEVIIDFIDGNSLYFCDLRLGFLHLITREGLNETFKELGIEPLSEDFSFEKFTGTFKGRRGVIKPLLMDQKLVCGIGNAYSNEIFFASGILPERKFPSLTDKELRNLWETIPVVLRKGIQNGGYIEEPFAAGDTLTGGQNNHFMVYDRGGQMCKVCGTMINEMKLNGRWTYFCNVCQT